MCNRFAARPFLQSNTYPSQWLDLKRRFAVLAKFPIGEQVFTMYLDQASTNLSCFAGSSPAVISSELISNTPSIIDRVNVRRIVPLRCEIHPNDDPEEH